MNGRAARRIRRATWQVLFSGSGESYRAVNQRLKREYKARPYHQRYSASYGYLTLSHREQEIRWRRKEHP